MKQIIEHIISQLLPCYPEDEARGLAWWMMEEITGLSRTQLQFGCKDTTFSPNMQEKLQETISRLLHFEPIQYIFGHTSWNGLDLKVTPATLIPRPETAELIDRINKQNIYENRKTVQVLDIGTGSGCIAIALKKAHPEWQITGIDISPEAIKTARENAVINKTDVHFIQMDIFSDSIGQILPLSAFDIIVSNPPYIMESEKLAMRPNVLDYEPPTALFVPDDNPLKFYRRIASLFSFPPEKDKVRSLFFEINEAFAQELAALLGSLGYTDIHITKDIYGKDRFIEGRMAE